MEVSVAAKSLIKVKFPMVLKCSACLYRTPELEFDLAMEVINFYFDRVHHATRPYRGEGFVSHVDAFCSLGGVMMAHVVFDIVEGGRVQALIADNACDKVPTVESGHTKAPVVVIIGQAAL